MPAKPWASLQLSTGLPLGSGRLEVLSALLAGMGTSDQASESLLAQKIFSLDVSSQLAADEYESRWMARLRDLTTLRALVFGRRLPGKQGLRQGFAFTRRPLRPVGVEASGEPPSLQDIIESATLVADLYWKLYRTCAGEFHELGKVALKLYEAIFNEPFRESEARLQIAHLTDAMQRDHGVPFLLLNLLREGHLQRAREVAQILLLGESQLDEEIRTPLYWMSELHVFQGRGALHDYDVTIRHLYHLCFTNPDRAGFLEIDSQFFPEFEMVSEIAREAFVFRETLIDWVLELWRDYQGLLDAPFQKSLEAMVGARSKIHDSRPTWETLWNRQREQDFRDYLHVAEGNSAYAAGAYKEALDCYERALELSPRQRAARLNRLFCLAQLGEKDRLIEEAAKVEADEELGAAAHYASGNALTLIGENELAERTFARLQEKAGWERKTDYYRSTFLFAHRRFEDALRFARLAGALNREDRGVQYHLSLCYNALGDKSGALKALQRLDSVPRPAEGGEWLDYYRFTLERDAGEHVAARETLRRIPSEYFEDEEELEDALKFARGQQDLVLLRHLKGRK